MVEAGLPRLYVCKYGVNVTSRSMAFNRFLHGREKMRQSCPKPMLSIHEDPWARLRAAIAPGGGWQLIQAGGGTDAPFKKP